MLAKELNCETYLGQSQGKFHVMNNSQLVYRRLLYMGCLQNRYDIRKVFDKNNITVYDRIILNAVNSWYSIPYSYNKLKKAFTTSFSKHVFFHFLLGMNSKFFDNIIVDFKTGSCYFLNLSQDNPVQFLIRPNIVKFIGKKGFNGPMLCKGYRYLKAFNGSEFAKSIVSFFLGEDQLNSVISRVSSVYSTFPDGSEIDYLSVVDQFKYEKFINGCIDPTKYDVDDYGWI